MKTIGYGSGYYIQDCRGKVICVMHYDVSLNSMSTLPATISLVQNKISLELIVPHCISSDHFIVYITIYIRNVYLV